MVTNILKALASNISTWIILVVLLSEFTPRYVAES